MNNSVNAKKMENLRNSVDVRLITNAKDYQETVNRTSFICQKIFNENLVAIHKIKEVLAFNKLKYLGMYILDLSKTLM